MRSNWFNEVQISFNKHELLSSAALIIFPSFLYYNYESESNLLNLFGAEAGEQYHSCWCPGDTRYCPCWIQVSLFFMRKYLKCLYYCYAKEWLKWKTCASSIQFSKSKLFCFLAGAYNRSLWYTLCKWLLWVWRLLSSRLPQLTSSHQPGDHRQPHSSLQP